MTLNAQDLNCLSADDARQIRQVIADAVFYKKSFETAQEQMKALTASRDEWKGLFESEKARADNVQGERITELRSANTKLIESNQELFKSNAEFRAQSTLDKQKLGEQNADILKLRASRKYYFGLGAATGFAAGAYVGYNARNIIPNGGSSGFARPQSRFEFKLPVRF